ncbi:MAG: hypothetical protein J0M12_15965 [Deltaproteobacteria bacterium]|nr:hypothetical protein [Deltaproteobacteria bacterium]
MSFHVRTLRALLFVGLAFSSLQNAQAQTTVVKATDVKGVKIDYEELKIAGTPMPSITGTPTALRLIQEVRQPGIPSMMMMAASPTPSGSTIPNDSGSAISTNFAGMKQFFLPMLPYSRPAFRPTTTTSVTSVKPTSTTTRETSAVKSTSGSYSMLTQASMAESASVDGGVVIGGSNTVNFTYGVEVFINEVACSGVHTPTTLAYQLGNDAPVPLFGGNPVSTGMTGSFSIPATGASLRFIATFATPSGCIAGSPRPSDDPNQSMTFINGQNVPDLLAAKNVTLQYQGQQALPNRLAELGFIDNLGNATLPPDKSVLVFEAANYSSSSAAIDMNDLGIVLTAPGPQAVDLVMHDTIGSDTSATDLALGIPSQISPDHTSFVFPVSLFTAPETGTLSQLKVVGYDYQSNSHPNNWTYEVSFYSSLAGVAAFPLYGDIANFTFSPSQMTRVPFGTPPPTAFGPSSYLLTFDLSNQQIPVSAGQGLYFVLRIVTYPGLDGTFRVSTSAIGGPYDYVRTTSSFISAQGTGYGRIAYFISESVQMNPPQIGEKTMGSAP